MEIFKPEKNTTHLESQEETSQESQEAKEIPESFDAVIVLGKNWRGYPFTPARSPEEGSRLHLSIESKMSALAAGEMYQAGLTKKLIFSTGKTLGEAWPSQARAMWEFTKKEYPDIPEESVLLEEESWDTTENAEEVKKIMDTNHIDTTALLTVDYHLPRAEKIFRAYGMNVIPVPSEEMLVRRSDHYKKFVENFHNSKIVKEEKLKEAILRGILLIDKKGQLPRRISRRIRGK